MLTLARAKQELLNIIGIIEEQQVLADTVSADAEKLYLEALDVYRRIAKSISRSVYEPEVAETLYRLGINYKTIEMSDKCNICFVEAKKLAECYKDTNPTCQQIYEALS